MPVDTDKPVELLLFDFLTEKIAAAVDGDVLFGDDLELHDTIWQSISKVRGVRISDATGDMSPVSGGVKEFNVSLQLVCFARVEGKNQKERSTALNAVFQLQKAVAGVLYGDASIGGRVCDVTILTMSRGYDEMDSKAYAIAMIPLLVNEAS